MPSTEPLLGIYSEDEALRKLSSRRLLNSDRETADTVRGILNDIQTRGDAALIDYTGKFDRIQLTRETLRVSKNEIKNAGSGLSAELRQAIETAARRIRDFHSRQKEETWLYRDASGSLLGQQVTPMDSAGLYIPGGKASYPSTLLMNAIPAEIAGVKRRVLCTPCRGIMDLPETVLYAAKICGIEEIYRVGGAQAVGALALGTETIAPVDKITGPGNRFVAEAKRQVFGLVSIDMIAGPSEIMVVADKDSDPEKIAVDLFSQAEHDEDAGSILLTTSKTFAEKVQRTAGEIVGKQPREAIIRKSLRNNGMIILADDRDAIIRIINRYAPEHLEILPSWGLENILGSVRHAGAVFYGEWTPEAVGDYMAGPNHTLPTSGTARFSSPLGVYDFLKKSSLISLSRKTLQEIGSLTAEFADAEGLHAHAQSIRQRIEKGE